MENHSLIEWIKNADSETGLKEVYSKYRNEFILWAIRHHSCSMEEAKDVFQQAMVIFYENIVYGKVTLLTTKVKTYVFSIGKNKLHELFREKNKHTSQFSHTQSEEANPFSYELDDEYEDRLKIVEKCLSKLGDPCKSILEQYYYHKKTMVEISVMLNYKNSDTVKNLKYKCLQRLKHIFETDA